MLALAVCGTVPWIDCLLPALRDALAHWHEQRRAALALGAAHDSGTSGPTSGPESASSAPAAAAVAAPSVARWLFEAFAEAPIAAEIAMPLCPGPASSKENDRIARGAARF